MDPQRNKHRLSEPNIDPVVCDDLLANLKVCGDP